MSSVLRDGVRHILRSVGIGVQFRLGGWVILLVVALDLVLGAMRNIMPVSHQDLPRLRVYRTNNRPHRNRLLRRR